MLAEEERRGECLGTHAARASIEYFLSLKNIRLILHKYASHNYIANRHSTQRVYSP